MHLEILLNHLTSEYGNILHIESKYIKLFKQWELKDLTSEHERHKLLSKKTFNI